ncbi:MAG: hypothetical protein AAF841_02980 [Pseudomonadota bacterium]
MFVSGVWAEFGVSRGFSDSERNAATPLFWEASGPRIHAVLRSDEDGKAVFHTALNADVALVAPEGDRVLSVLGTKTSKGAFKETQPAHLAARIAPVLGSQKRAAATGGSSNGSSALATRIG